MDAQQEKKWFVYIDDHHEGPFSAEDLHGKVSEGKVNTQTYVWADGMSDWQVITEVTGLSSLVSGDAPKKEATKTSTKTNGRGKSKIVEVEPEKSRVTAADIKRTEEAEISISEISQTGGGGTPEIITEEPSLTSMKANGHGAEHHTGTLETKATTASMEQFTREQKVEIEAAPSGENTKTALRKRNELFFGKGQSLGEKLLKNAKSFIRSSIRWIVLAALAGGLYYSYEKNYLNGLLEIPAVQKGMQAAQEVFRPYLNKAVDLVPALAKWIPPISNIDSISPEDFENLKSAARSSPDKVGAHVAAAVTKTEPLAPSFWMASNMPDGTNFEFFIEGVPETLLGKTFYFFKDRVALLKKVARTSTFRMSDGSAIPRGEYQIIVTESEQQPDAVKTLLSQLPVAQLSAQPLPDYVPKGRKVLYRNVFFLGGAKDDQYRLRLKKFHEEMRTKASGELSELSMLVTTLEGQFKQTSDKYKNTKTIKKAPQRNKSWNQFHTSWLRLSSELVNKSQGWTREFLDTNGYFYPAFYDRMRLLAQDVVRVHEIHHKFFSGAVDKKTYDNQLAEAISQAQISFTQLKKKIEDAQKLLASSTGMPKREAL
ncbi:DUF4339 domain-containing protein [bacterium]|nr:DUF4339 domain-containing protein [bacterium]